MTTRPRPTAARLDEVRRSAAHRDDIALDDAIVEIDALAIIVRAAETWVTAKDATRLLGRFHTKEEAARFDTLKLAEAALRAAIGEVWYMEEDDQQKHEAIVRATIDRIASSAHRVGDMVDRRDAAFSLEHQAEAELLEQIVASIRPALPALLSKIDGLDVEGVRVDHDLVLTEDGRFIELTEKTGVAVLAMHEVTGRFPLLAIVQRLEALLRAQESGRMIKVAELAKKRAEWLGSLLRILKPIDRG